MVRLPSCIKTVQILVLIAVSVWAGLPCMSMLGSAEGGSARIACVFDGFVTYWHGPTRQCRTPLGGIHNPAPNTTTNERQADPVIELQLEKAGVRLGVLLNETLK